MAIVDNSIKSFVDFDLTMKNMVETEKREKNGRLTAGMLWQPKRFQLLKYLEFMDKPCPDPFALRKFKRGKDVEQHIMNEFRAMGILAKEQAEESYRGVYGLGDAILDPTLYDEEDILSQYDPKIIELAKIKTPSIIDNFFRVKPLLRNLPKAPYEVKSVTNRAYKYIVDKGEIGWHYKIQAGFYGLAENSEHFGLVFIASDDHREHVMIFKTREMKAEIDQIITEYDQMIKDWEATHKVPAWEVHDKWMDNPQYMAYDSSWATCTEQEFVERVLAMKALEADIKKGTL